MPGGNPLRNGQRGGKSKDLAQTLHRNPAHAPNYVHRNYFVITSGGGVDYHLNQPWAVGVDGEYQYWPQFTFGAMSSGGLSVGARYYIFS
jgi:hypothetical protein